MFGAKVPILDPNLRLDDGMKMVLNDTLKNRLVSELTAHVKVRGSRHISFMLAGPEETALKPAIIIFCQKKTEKAAIQRHFDKLQWLTDLMRQHDFKIHVYLEKISTSGTTIATTPEESPPKTDSKIIVPLKVNTLCGRIVYLSRTGEHDIQISTFGGFILVGNTLYGTLAKHPFKTWPTSSTTETNSGDSDTSDDNESESETDSIPFTLACNDPATVQESASLLATASSTCDLPVSNPRLQISPVDDDHLSLRLTVLIPGFNDVYETTVPLDADLAFADFTQLPSDTLRQILLPNKTLNEDIQDFMTELPGDRCPVTILAAGVEPQMGYLNSQSVSLQFEASNHIVRLVTTDSPLPMGCSGAWVTSENKLCGFIMAIQEHRPWAYMMPIDQVLAEAKLYFHTEDIRLPTTAEIAGMRTRGSVLLVVPKDNVEAANPGNQLGISLKEISDVKAADRRVHFEDDHSNTSWSKLEPANDRPSPAVKYTQIDSPSTCKLQRLPGSPVLSKKCTAIFIFVPRIGTEPVATWRQSSIVKFLYEISGHLTNSSAYFAYWDHGLPTSKILSWPDLHTSANRLLNQILQTLSTLPSEVCPIIFIGHSTGGVLIKETLRSWYQSPEHGGTARLCTAGSVLLGTPHTLILQRASSFCRLISLASLSQPYFDTGYDTQFVQLCREFEGLSMPTFSIYELETTRIATLKTSLIVDRELARFGAYKEELWPAKTSHNNLCNVEITVHMAEALESFLSRIITSKREIIDRIIPRRFPSSIVSRLSLHSRPSNEGGWFFESSVGSPISSIPTSFELSPIPNKRSNTESSRPTLSLYGPKPQLEYKVRLGGGVFQRDEIVRPLEDVLLRPGVGQGSGATRDQNRVFALCGGSGLGKSTIAAHYVQRHRKRYNVILWVNAGDVTKLFFDYTNISFQLGLSDETMPHDMVECQTRVRNWLLGHYQPLHGRSESVKWLLVLDNVSNPEDLRGFWPDRGGGDILMTTQRSLVEMNNFCGEFGTEVQPFDPNVAVNFLKYLTDDHQLGPDELIQAIEIAEVLGGSPLALVSLSSLIKQGKLDSKWVERHSRRRASNESSRSRPDLSGEALDQVADVIFPLLDKLQHGKTLMDVISFLDSDGIEDWILIDAASSVTLGGYPLTQQSYARAKAELLAANLIFGKNEEVVAHRMIQDATKRKMDVERFQLIFEAAARILSCLWPTMTIAERHNKRRWGRVEVLLRHVRKLHQLHEAKDDLILSFGASFIFAKLLNDAGWCMYERGTYEDGKKLASHAREIAEDLDETESQEAILELLDLRSNIYYTLGAIAQITHDHGESLNLHAKLLVYRKKLRFKSGRIDALLAHAYNEIGNDFMTTDEAEIAIGFYKRSIKIYEGLEDFKHTMLALPSVNLGLAFWLQGDFDTARSVVQKALHDQEEALGVDDGLTMKTGRLLYAMGNIAYSQGRFKESLAYHERALRQFESTIGVRHNWTCDVKYRLADHYARLDDYDNAIKTLDSALQVVFYRPLFEREKARIMFKKGSIMKASGWFSNPVQYQQYLDGAAEVYYKYRGRLKREDELTEIDFDGLVMFWSR